jgi:hypothetical protein
MQLALSTVCSGNPQTYHEALWRKDGHLWEEAFNSLFEVRQAL